MSYYGTIAEANAYFANRLHSDAWEDSAATDRPKALTQATQVIDALNYKGVKNPVYLVLYDSNGDLVDPEPSQSVIMTADATQNLEFPRGSDTSTPTTIEYACYEIAYSLLDGVDLEAELQNLRVKQNVYSAVRTTYQDGYENVENILYGIPSSIAWRWIKPYLDFDSAINLLRVD